MCVYVCIARQYVALILSARMLSSSMNIVYFDFAGEIYLFFFFHW